MIYWVRHLKEKHISGKKTCKSWHLKIAIHSITLKQQKNIFIMKITKFIIKPTILTKTQQTELICQLIIHLRLCMTGLLLQKQKM